MPANEDYGGGRDATNPLAAPPQPGTPDADYPSVFPDLLGRKATEDEFREYLGELQPDDEPRRTP
jgi:hypothetical protein